MRRSGVGSHGWGPTGEVPRVGSRPSPRASEWTRSASSIPSFTLCQDFPASPQQNGRITSFHWTLHPLAIPPSLPMSAQARVIQVKHVGAVARRKKQSELYRRSAHAAHPTDRETESGEQYHSTSPVSSTGRSPSLDAALSLTSNATSGTNPIAMRRQSLSKMSKMPSNHLADLTS